MSAYTSFGGERALFPQRHAAIDVIPYRRRERRVKRHGVCVVYTRGETRRRRVACLDTFPAYQRGSMGLRNRLRRGIPRSPSGHRAAHLPWRSRVPREFLSRRADRDIPGADFFRARGPPDAIGGRLCPGSLADPEAVASARRSLGKPIVNAPIAGHSPRLNGIVGAPNADFRQRVRSSIWRRRRAWVEPCPVRPCSAT